MRCLDCHYSLKNLTEHRCPECGRAFDPRDGRTFETPGRRRRVIENRASWIIVVLIFVLLMIGGYFKDTVPDRTIGWTAMGLALLLLTGTATLMFALRRRGSQR